MLINNPLVSIVTPVFNRVHIIQPTIESVIAQNYKNWELLLVDDGSSDNIETFIKDNYGDDLRIKFIKRERLPKSASTCRNVGIENANGDFVIFLDSDDLLEKFCLEQRINAMNNNVDLDFAVFRFSFIDPNGVCVENNYNNGKDPLINFLSNKSYWNITCPIWRKPFLEKIHGFNQKFLRYQDIEMHIRAITTTDVKYKIFFEYYPDSIVVPSVKKPNYYFLMDVFESLQLFIPETYKCLHNINKPQYIKFMRSYLKEWLLFLSFSHFDSSLCLKTINVFELFEKYHILSSISMNYYKINFKLNKFIVDILCKIYSKMLFV